MGLPKHAQKLVGRGTLKALVLMGPAKYQEGYSLVVFKTVRDGFRLRRFWFGSCGSGSEGSWVVRRDCTVQAVRFWWRGAFLEILTPQGEPGHSQPDLVTSGITTSSMNRV